ncbi:MAG: hypothetical protein IPJ88_11420 [Myxococcales bacterium]|nr:MAG: hypothetical protein IPJ88_11420 [Myxococcales bacterium]
MAEKAKSIKELDKQIAKFESQKRWSDMIRSIVAKAELVEDEAEKVQLYSRAASMYLEKSSNQSEAIKCYEAVLEFDSNNEEAIVQLKQMYEKRRDWEKLIGVMRREAESLDDDAHFSAVLEMAELATERLRKPQICIELWQSVLEKEPEHPEALANLAKLYERGRDWEPLAKVLEVQTQQLTDPAELISALQTLGVIYADKLNDNRGAVQVFERILEVEPTDRRAQEQLKKRYIELKEWDQLEIFFEETERWDELIRVLEREAESPDISTKEKADLLFRSARLWDTRKQKADRAARAYEKILSIDPGNLDAATALSPIYESAGDSKKLAKVYEVRLEHAKDADEKIFLLRELGLIYEQKIKDPQTAFERYLAAFSVDPQRELLREDVERLVSQVDGWQALLTAYGDAIEAVIDPEASAELRIGYGRVLGSVGRTDDAIEQYRHVYEAQPENTLAMAALERLYKEKGEYDALIEIQERRAELETDPDARKKLDYDRASLLANELKKTKAAIAAYQNIIDTYGPDEKEAFDALGALFAEKEQWEDLADLLEQRIQTEIDEEGLANLKNTLG